MICPRCTLLHSTYTVACMQCGHPLQGSLQRATTFAVEKGPTGIGIVSGAALLSCLAASLIVPAAASQALSAGGYFGIISIANVWLSIYRGEEQELLRGMRGVAYSLALMVSLVSEVARLQGVQSLPLPFVGGLPVPSALVTEMLAAFLIVLDPLLLTPLLRWIADGVQHGEPAA